MNWKSILQNTIYEKITYYDVSRTPTLVMITDLKNMNDKFYEIHRAYIDYIKTIPSTYNYLNNSPGFLTDNLCVLDLITIWDGNNNFKKWLTNEDWCIIDLEKQEISLETFSLFSFIKNKQQQLSFFKDWSLDKTTKSIFISEPSSF